MPTEGIGLCRYIVGKNRVGCADTLQNVVDCADTLCLQKRLGCADTLWVGIEWAVQIHYRMVSTVQIHCAYRIGWAVQIHCG